VGTGDLVAAFIDFGEVALAEQIFEFENVVLYFFLEVEFLGA